MISSARMTAIDRNAAALGIPQRSLMESAGNAIAREVREVAEADDHIHVIAGRGNNGGDALVAARFLDDNPVRVTIVGDPATFTTDIARANYETLVAAEMELSIVRDATQLDAFGEDILIDGLLGTGIDGSIREPVRSAIEAINSADATVISVDVPSGIDPDGRGDPDIAVAAERVVTFHAMKPGLTVLDVPITVADIGIPQAAERFVGPGDLLSVLDRRAQSHKGDHGRILVIGGGPYVGAPALSAIAALRGGADLVEVAVPASIADAVAGFAPELIVRPLPGDRFEPTHVDLFEEAIERADVIAIGPGLGDDPETHSAVVHLLEGFDGRVVVDADALEILPDATTAADIIATPHGGEFADMGFERPADWRAGEQRVAEAATSLEATILLKGRYDVISDGTQTRINRTGNPGMTTGGTGDTLTGVVAAFFARLPAIDAAAAGAYVVGAAGDRCAEQIGYGFLASDVATAIPAVMRDA